MQRRPYLQALTGLRFVAAVQVVFEHLLADGRLEGMPLILRQVVARGYVAVDLFFILSGFILTYTYLGDGERTIAGGAGRRGFWAARFARIYPVYAIGLVVTMPFFVPGVLANQPGAVAAVLAVPTLVQAWLPLSATLWNPPSWSLSAEVFFYALFPFLAPRFLRVGPRRLAVALVGAYVAALVAPSLYYAAFPPGTAVTPLGPADIWERVVVRSPLVHLPEFMFGCALGHLFLRNDCHQPSRRSPQIALVAIASAALYASSLYLVDRLDVPRAYVENGLLAPIMALLIYSLAVSERGLAWLLSLRFVSLLGEASYGLYLLHIPVIWWIDRLARSVSWGGEQLLQRRWFFLVEALAAVAVSVLVFLVVERPGRRALRALLDPQSRRADSAGALRLRAPARTPAAVPATGLDVH